VKIKKTSLIVVILIVVLFFGNYAWAWFDSYNLSVTYYRQAEASYQDGRHVDSLMGYKEYIEGQEKRVFVGGYIQVVNIWASPWAFPRPTIYKQAEIRADQVIQGLSHKDARLYLEMYLGRENPYLGKVMLRLGQTYEENGDERGALEIYRSIIDLFRADPALIERANERIAALESE